MSERRGAQHWTLRRRIGLSFAMLGALLAVLIGAVVLSTVEFVLAGNRVVYRWQPAVLASQRLLTDLVDQESGLRAYALARDPRFADQYRGALAAQRADAKHVASLIGADKELQRQLGGLTVAATRWQATVAEPAMRGIASGDRAALGLVESAVAGRRFEAVRTKAASLSRDVQTRSTEARRTRNRFGALFVVAISLTTLILILIASAIWRGLHRWVLEPVDRLGRQTREVARGDTYRQIEPSGPVEIIGLGRDVEAMRLQIAGQLARAEEIQDELRRRGEELTRSNDDLQQFAYVASHDLSEPLRKIANFCQLLERQYADQLDDRAKEYIYYAVDGAKRMQVLISDLLALSRVGRTTEEFAPVSLDVALAAAEENLATQIEEAKARVERVTPLPTVSGDLALLTSLMENLLSNAVKYRRPDVPPVVRVSAEHDEANKAWTISVSDNGIGIEPQYAERIFVIFQRLHLRDRYGGTGIGLALARKIVEFHGGQIWLDDVHSTNGATFRFALPEGGTVAQSRD